MEKAMVSSFDERKPISSQTKAEASISPETKIGTNGLRKNIVQRGVSWQTPIPGDEVEVHYNVSLQEGEYWDSSRDRGNTFRFRLGHREVIKGWDEGIATMTKGEKAVFTVPPELAYGETGCHPMIPPNSTLVFDVELISWYPIRDVSGDGGILKKIVEEGEGWATPNHADEVLVKYVAKDGNGLVVAKSDEGLEFSLENGHLCPAMSKAVRTMRKGEKAVLSVKLSYGASIFDDISPSQQDLTIHLELVSWRSVIDVKGDGEIVKKVAKKGEAFDRPNEGSLAKVVYIAKLGDGAVVERRGSEDEPFEYVCGEEQIHQGLDSAVMTMRKGEESIVKIASESSLVYEIKLVDFIKEKPFWKMDARERIATCQSKTCGGNVLFRHGKFRLASNKYAQECFKIRRIQPFFQRRRKLQAKTLRLSCYLNSAACELNLGEYKEATGLCTKVLQLDPDNLKALFRRSQAYIRTSDLEKAEEDINRALLIDPSNKEVKIKQKELKELQRQYVKEEAKIYSTMISRIC